MKGVMSHTTQDETEDGARIRGEISYSCDPFFFDGAICLGWCDILKVIATQTHTHTDTHTDDKTRSRNPPYLSSLPDLLIFKHHFRLSQSSDPKGIRILMVSFKVYSQTVFASHIRFRNV